MCKEIMAEELKTKKVKKFDKKKVRKILKKANDFVLDLLKKCNVPESVEDTDLDAYIIKPANVKPGEFPKIPNGASRVQSAQELEERLEMIKNKLKSKKPKPSNKEKKKKEVKRLKNKMNHKKIMKVEEMKREAEADEDAKEDVKVKPTPIKPVFNEDGKMIFSKFDFASRPGAKAKKSKKDKVINDPRKALKNIKEHTKEINELIEKGEEQKALEIKQELAWKKVFDKTDGKKVKDDPNLLYKTLKKKKIQKKKSKQKWIERKQKVEHDIAARQKKRKENIDKKIREKKVNKMKRLSKRGRVIPGF